MSKIEYNYRRLENALIELKATEELGDPLLVSKKLCYLREQFGYGFPAYVYFEYQDLLERNNSFAKVVPIQMFECELDWHISNIRGSLRIYMNGDKSKVNPEFIKRIQRVFRAYMYSRNKISRYTLQKYRKLIDICLNTDEFSKFLEVS